MARLVRCPKCGKLLVEYPEVPVYKCGGCSTVLRAKNHKTTSENVLPGSSQTNQVDSSPEHALSDVGSTSSAKEMLSSALPAPSTEEDSANESTQINQPDVMSENGFSDKEMPPPCSSVPSGGEDHEEEEKMRRDMSPDLIVNHKHHEIEEHLESEKEVTGVETQQDEIIQSENDDCPSEQVEKPLGTSNDVEHSSQSVAQGTTSEEDIVDTEKHYDHDSGIKSPANMSPQTYDGSISSSDDIRRDYRHPLSRRTTRRWSNKTAAKDKEENARMGAYLDDEDQARALLSNSGQESYYVDVVKNFNAIKQEIVSKYQSGELEQGRSFDSAEFLSVDSSMDSERIRPYQSPLRGDLSDHMELLRKVDELKAQIIDLYAERGNIRSNYPSMPSNSRGYSRNPVHEYPELPFSGHTHCSCLHCLENQRAHFPAHELHPNPPNSGSLGNQSHKSEKSHLKEKPKRHCRPVSGAAPFVVCYHCMKLLQLPADFIISRKKLHKLQCGACNEILMLSFPCKARVQSETRSELDGSSTNIGGYGRAGPSSHSESNIPSRLHRLMGYDSATEVLYKRHDFDEGYESTFTPSQQSYRRLAEGHGYSGARARNSGIPHSGQVRYASSPLPMENSNEYDLASRLNARRASVRRPGLEKNSPNSM